MHYVKGILFCQVESLRPRDPPPVWIVFAFAIWGFISMIGCAVNMAHAVPLLKGSASERPSVPRRNLVQHAEFLIVSMNVADSRMAELFGQPIGSDWRQSKEDTMTKVDDILMFFCVSGLFAGVVIAVTTLPV